MSEQASFSEQMKNVPNRISAARLGLAFVVFALIPLQQYWAALIVFVIAAGTDWVDGWYARKYNLVTQLGRILDPFCDKILICGAYILLAVAMAPDFAWYQGIAGWMAVVVVGRELLVTVIRSMIEGQGGDFSAKMAGKLKMVFQCAAVVLSLVVLAMHASDPEKGVPLWLMWLTAISIWGSVISTLHSGLLYVFAAIQLMESSQGSSE